ncbi:hypothetical protein CR513_03022, partial [Mucuna pruriens]
MPPQGNSPSLEDLMKQLATTICELQQHAIPAEYDHHHPRPQDTNRITARSSNLPSRTIPNLRGNVMSRILYTSQGLKMGVVKNV